MRVAFTVAISVCILCGMIQPGRSEFVSGHVLHNWCSTNRLAAGAFVLGVIDTSLRLEREGKIGSRDYALCFLEALTSTEITDLVCNRLRDNTTTRHLSAQSLVVDGLRKELPCG